MTTNVKKPPANIELVPAALEQQPVLANLIELYAHDFSEFDGLDLGSDGRFGYEPLPLYWSDPSRHPFLVKIDGKLAGLVLVKRGSEVSGNLAAWDMVEFFVIRRYRRRGIGTHIAHEVWRRFPGTWEVRVMESNTVAFHFWERAISGFAGEVARPTRIKKDDEDWNLFSFESKATEPTP
jgi:predicted acetyltransferase